MLVETMHANHTPPHSRAVVCSTAKRVVLAALDETDVTIRLLFADFHSFRPRVNIDLTVMWFRYTQA